MNQYLWNLRQSLPAVHSNETSIPQLWPVSNMKSIYNKTTSGTGNRATAQYYTVDVIKDFNWTLSPKGDLGRAEVPRVELIEKRLVSNALVNQIGYSIGTIKSQAEDITTTYRSLLEEAGTKLTKFFKIKDLEGLTKAVKQSTVVQIGTAAIDAAQKAAETITGQDWGLVNSSNLLTAYKGLYWAEDTKWIYQLPYFDDKTWARTNSFSDAQGSQTTTDFFGLISAGNSILDNIVNIGRTRNVARPGTYQERVKQPDFPTDGSTIDVKFPLINTGGTFDDVIRNFQLAFLLLYQNTPSRLSKDVIEPSVIYELSIPGVVYMPFAYVSNIQVSFSGARRQMKLRILVDGDPTTIETIVPDAYVISLTFQGLVGETRNFLGTTVSKYDQQVITVNKTSLLSKQDTTITTPELTYEQRHNLEMAPNSDKDVGTGNEAPFSIDLTYNGKTK